MGRYGDAGPAGKGRNYKGRKLKMESLRDREVSMSQLLDIPNSVTKWWNKLVLKIPRSVDRTRKAVVRVGMDTFLEAETAGF